MRASKVTEFLATTALLALSENGVAQGWDAAAREES